MRVIPVPCRTDNYAYVLVDENTRSAVVVDPSEATPVKRRLQVEGLRLGGVWLTHHHHDHVGGVEELVTLWGSIPVLGSEWDLTHGRIPRQTQGLTDEETFTFGSHVVQVFWVPGHTLGALCYLVDGNLFSGDTLFLGGCGRVSEGTMEMMVGAMNRLRDLPEGTRIYCGHEYTVKNLAFAQRVEPDNTAVARRLAGAKERRLRQEATVPGTIAEERATNPFFRFDGPPLLSLGANPVESFTVLRQAKDRF